MDYLHTDALPEDFQRLLKADYLLNFYTLVGASSMNAEYILRFDEVILLPEPERKAAVRGIIMNLNATEQGSPDEGSAEILDI